MSELNHAPASEDWEKELYNLLEEISLAGAHAADDEIEKAHAYVRALASRPTTNSMSTDVKLVDRPALTVEDVERVLTSVHGDPGFQPIELDGSGFDAWLITSDLLPAIADQINTALTEEQE